MEPLKIHLQKNIDAKQRSQHAINFILWIVLASSFIAFSILTIIYTFLKTEAIQFGLIFKINTILIILSSLVIHQCLKYYQRDELKLGLIALVTTTLISLAFSIFQIIGWKDLNQQYKNLIGSQLYSKYMLFVGISGFHLLHLAIGLLLCLVLILDHFRFKLHAKSINKLRYVSYYWHFVGTVWVILFLLF